MKLIKEIKHNGYIEYYYKNNIFKRVWNDGETYWYYNNGRSKLDGARIENCIDCKNNNCFKTNSNNKYKRHFYLHFNFVYPKKFAEKTNHIVCEICCDFCNQECFI